MLLLHICWMQAKVLETGSRGGNSNASEPGAWKLHTAEYPTTPREGQPATALQEALAAAQQQVCVDLTGKQQD